MKFCDERIQKHLLNGGKVKRKLGSCNIIMHIGQNGFIFDNSGSFYVFCEQDLTSDDWEIVEPEYNWDKIIKDKILCVFSHQENFEYKMISILSKKDEDNDCYFTSQGTRYRYCRPFNPNDFNIAKNIKEYEK